MEWADFKWKLGLTKPDNSHIHENSYNSFQYRYYRHEVTGYFLVTVVFIGFCQSVDLCSVWPPLALSYVDFHFEHFQNLDVSRRKFGFVWPPSRKAWGGVCPARVKLLADVGLRRVKCARWYESKCVHKKRESECLIENVIWPNASKLLVFKDCHSIALNSDQDLVERLIFCRNMCKVRHFLRNPAHFTAQSTFFPAQFVLEFPHNFTFFSATYRDPRV